MSAVLDTPLFGIIISIIGFEIGLLLSRRTGSTFMNPLLIAITLVIGFLLMFDIPVETYSLGGDYIQFLLGPATVILAVPLYRRITLLRQHFFAIIIGIFVGSLTAIGSVWVLTQLVELPDLIQLSMVPKSVTTPIGIEIAREIGGDVGLAVAVIVLTGIIGAVIGPTVCSVFRIKNEVAVGISLGTASHAVGTSRAIELGEVQGSMSSLAIGIMGLFTVLVTPLFLWLMNLIGFM